ncbi:ABC transporter permease [Actinocorallia libanotica]|uniref:ABC-2 type transport system permease protein n=1 Tax=Actinocorallia libanotica TaxID=46162 RepID=A0ABN1S0E1_9ACTN
MRPRLPRIVTAELLKLATLPVVLSTGVATIAAAPVLAALSGAAAGTHAFGIVAGTVPFLQVGPILLGVLAAGGEYTGGQVRTTLTAMPRRLPVLAGKSAAALLVLLATGTAAAAAGAVTARSGRAPAFGSVHVAMGIVAHLVAMGLLALALAVLLRSVLRPLAALLTLVFVASPLLGGLTEKAYLLPDQAGRLLHDPLPGTTPGTWTGVVVLLAWLTGVGAAATAAFLVRDA